MKSTVILVGADKGGVGKTTLSRALVDYLGRKGVSVRCFDTEYPRAPRAQLTLLQSSLDCPIFRRNVCANA